MPTISVAFHGVPRSEPVWSEVRRWVARLQHVCEPILHCNVMIDRPHDHGRHQRYVIRIVIGIAGEEIALTHLDGHQDLHVAVCAAFVAMRGELDRAGRQAA